MLKRLTILLLAIVALPATLGQQPQVRVNYLNVCAPSEADQKEIASALGRIPLKPGFSADFEVARGRSSAPDVRLEGASEAGPSNWVRIRREFSPESAFVSVQYSYSTDDKTAVETLVFRLREPRDLLQISIQDSASAAGGAHAMLAADTPPNRVKIERFGKPGLALARCTGADQSRYEPLLHSAAQIMSLYRGLLAVRRTVPADLARLTPQKKTSLTQKKPGQRASPPARH